MLDSFLRSVTKDSYGPISFHSQSGTFPVVLQKFHDSFSLFGWGKMPDALKDHGRSNAIVYSFFNKLVQSPGAWKDFLRSPEALTFRKAAASIPQAQATQQNQVGFSMSSVLNELSGKFPIRSSVLGTVNEGVFRNMHLKEVLHFENLESELNPENTSYPVCEFFQEEKVPAASVMGRTVWDYTFWKRQSAPKVLPFEIHCHFSLTQNTLDNLHFDSLALPKTASIATLQAGTEWDFPIMEMVLSQNPFQRKIGFSEALLMTDWKMEQLQSLLLTAAWVAAFVRNHVQKAPLNTGLNTPLNTYLKSPMKLISVPLKFAIDGNAGFILTDSLSLGDLVLEKDGKILTSEIEEFYQKTTWFDAVIKSQKQGLQSGAADWKRFCAEPSPWLDARLKENFEKKYRETALALTGHHVHQG